MSTQNGTTNGTTARPRKLLARAFEQELALAGGSLPTWLILLSLSRAAVGTPTESWLRRSASKGHPPPRGLERAGLVRRARDPDNRRVQRVELTEAGDAAFHRLRRTASSFDQRLRSGLDDSEIQRLRELLAQLLSNVTGEEASAGERPAECVAAS